MTSKHPKLERPSDVDLTRNPLIGGSKGVTMAQASLDDLELIEGANTVEGDIENDINAQGGIDKAEVMNRRRAPPRTDHAGRPRPPRKTNEQQLRALERRPELPDADEIAHESERD
jgi:hypothetical protein